ncbi:MAPEG family protein [Massilia sp. PWRC2]|uniref:MAPEG family protein n=1 Tax=Massilia sp. PWRC2 TaxID=2804626 RepID=UPI003CF56096
MTTELTALAWTLVLALVQIFLASTLRTRETGLRYNVSARDTDATPPGRLTARAQRAQANLFETLPLFAGAVLIAHAANLHSSQTVFACWLYLGARIIYLPLYLAGVPVLRTLVFAGSVWALFILLKTLLMG